jgi:hypothetical protein
MMKIDADPYRLAWRYDQLRECIAQVHQIEEREFGVKTHRRQHLEERFMPGICRIVIARAQEIAASQPGLQRQAGPLIAAFDVKRPHLIRLLLTPP